jgi:hypothetical protein
MQSGAGGGRGKRAELKGTPQRPLPGSDGLGRVVCLWGTPAIHRTTSLLSRIDLVPSLGPSTYSAHDQSRIARMRRAYPHLCAPRATLVTLLERGVAHPSVAEQAG